jgi:hypothetical protein
LPNRPSSGRAEKQSWINSGLRAVAQNDVPSCGKLSHLRALDRREIQAESLVPLGIAAPDTAKLTISLVPRVALDETFGRQQLLVPLPDSRVNVRRRAASVRDRLDRPEVVFAGRAREEAAVSLEIRVELFVALGVLLEIGPIPIALPDFDDGIAERVALGVEEPAAQVCDLADGGGDRVVDDEQVVVGIKGELRR